MKRPRASTFRSWAVCASCMGLRGGAIATARNLEPGRVLGRERERQERIVRALEREGAVVAEGFDRSGLGGDGGEVGGEKRRVDQHMLSTARTAATCHVRPCASQAS